jgi:hypothetical protein
MQNQTTELSSSTESLNLGITGIIINGENTKYNDTNKPETSCTQCSKVVTQDIFNFIDPISIVSRNTFPNKQELNEQFNEDQFNRLLQYIKTQINNARLENINFVRILNTVITHYTPQIILDVKLYLQNKQYTIVDIEDANSIYVGWKLSW